MYQVTLGVAGGTIAPSVFVKLSTAADHTFLQATAASANFGISQVGMKRAPGLIGSDTTIAAQAGDQIQVFPPGSSAPVLCAGTFGAGAFVKSDANGNAIAAASGDVSCGIAWEAGASGQLVEVYILPPGTKMP